MSTLIVSGDNYGTNGRCDSKCHDATSPVCHCICGGRYHGKKSGSAELKQAVHEFGREMVERLESEGHDCSGLREALGMAAPRCEAHYKTTNKFVMRGERCRNDALMEVHIERCHAPVLLCKRHYSQWCDEPLSKAVKWTAQEIKHSAVAVGAGGSEGV